MEIELQPHRAFAIFSLEICVIQATPTVIICIVIHEVLHMYCLITSLRDRSCSEKKYMHTSFTNSFSLITKPNSKGISVIYIM